MILKETILSVFNERGTLLKWLKKVEALITENTLLKPINNPQSTELVAVDNTGAQVMLGVGAGLTIANGVLKFADVYDGTVVIEKANGVLGLRRFKESVTPFGNVSSLEELQTLYSENYFEITPIESYNRMTPCVDVDEEGLCVVVGTDSQLVTLISLQDLLAGSNRFEVLSTSNSTVDEWLLANTEGVSV